MMVFLLCILLAISGCGGHHDAQQMVKFLNTNANDEGIAYFSKEIEKNPQKAFAYHHRATFLIKKASSISGLTDDEKIKLYNQAIADEDVAISLTLNEATIPRIFVDTYTDLATGKQVIDPNDKLRVMQSKSKYYITLNRAAVISRANYSMFRSELLAHSGKFKEAIDSYNEFIMFYQKQPEKIIKLNPDLKSMVQAAKQDLEKLKLELAKKRG